MNRAHFALKLRTDRPKKDKTYQIYLYANINSKIAWYTTNQSVEQKYWNEGKSEVKASCPNWSKINTEINNYSSKASNLLAEFNLKGKELTRKHLNDVLRSAKYLSKDYYQFVENYKNSFSSNYSKLTLKGFVTHINKLKEYSNTLDFNDIDVHLWRKYESHLKKKGNRPNTIHKQSRLMKKFLNKAVEFKIIESNPLSNLNVKNSEGNRQFLTVNEVNILTEHYKKIQTKKYKQKEVLRYFLFACFTSLRYGDIYRLRFKNILNNDTINQVADKTGILVSIPLSNKALNLIGKRHSANEKVFRVLSNQPTNRYLKDIMKDAGIEKQITFHCARHTWATITLELTGDVALVSNVLGHTSIKTTQIYAKVIENKKKKAMDLWDNF